MKRDIPERPLLVPVDFGPASMQALRVAEELAPQLGAPIVLLQVFDFPPPPTTELPPHLVHRYYDEADAAARRSLELLAGACGLPYQWRRGEPAAKILDAIDELRPAMVVMGTTGRHGLKRWLLGSVAERVVRESSVPVITVRVTEAEAREQRAAPAAAPASR